MIYFFFVDFNDCGDYYRVGIEAVNKEVAEGYLQTYSKDVRFHKENKKRTKRDMGNRRIPNGTIVYCKFATSKISTFSSKIKKCSPDPRHREVCI